jgi:hypothetical protein
VSNGPNHPQPRFCLSKDKRTHLIYLGEGRQEQARMRSDNHKKKLKIVEGVTILNMTPPKNSRSASSASRKGVSERNRL